MGVFEDLGAVELREELHRQGFDDVVRIVDDLHEFDPSKLRLLAAQVYGTSHGGSLGVGTVVPDRLAKLVEASEEQRRSSLTERWGGPAYENFASYMREVETGLAKEEDRLRLLGDALVQAADIFEEASHEVSVLIAVTSTALTIRGLTTSLIALSGIASSIAGYILFIADTARTNARNVGARVDAISAATSSLQAVAEARKAEFAGASGLMEGVLNAIEETATLEDWDRESKDPYT